MKADPTTTELTEQQAYLVLNALPNMGSVARNRLLEAFGDPRAVLSADARQLEEVEGVRAAARETVVNWRRHFDIGREEESMAAIGADFISVRDPAYPDLLRKIDDPPVGLYRQGGYAGNRPNVAIVGSRRATLYGRDVAKRFGAELARLGFCVVSGMARGIDTAAHEGALSAGGPTVAVFGAGLDVVYPPENRPLARRIAETGALISEFPCGCPPGPQSFAMRNRIVSGLSLAVIVVESDVDGGGMITARFAGEQGRLLYAVPGRIDQPTSAGCHQLIRDGATLLTSVDDILSELSYLDGLAPRPVAEKADAAGVRPAPAGLTPEERAVLDCFAGGSILTPDALGAQTHLPAATLSAALMMLEIKQLVGRRMDGAYEAVG